MTEQASHLAKEARGLQQGLKEALKTKEPWDREIEFQRKNLRWQYLRLLLVHPYAKESKDVENHLWMQTSYGFIAIYKSRLAALDKTLQARQQHQQRQGGNGHGVVEYRKLMQRFRQFLAEEKKFWVFLIKRFQRSFALAEAHDALVELGIIDNTEDVLPDAAEPQSTALSTNARNQFQFPPEDATPPPPPPSSADHEGRLVILSKALVCLGDIERYREFYNESGGRPKAGLDEGGPARKNARNRRGGASALDNIPRVRDYSKAEGCYKQAQLLVPDEGNPSHQLAIIATYQKDNFATIVHYYRSLCVRQPYDTASENLGVVLGKALDFWRAKAKREKGQGDKEDAAAPLDPRVRVFAFKEKVVVLHAFWRLCFEKMQSISPGHAENVLTDFSALVSERHLPDDTISQTVVLSQGALWKHRMIRDPPAGSKTKSPAAAASTSPAAVESSIATHVLALHRALLDIGITEIAEAPTDDAVTRGDLAQRITASFRRTLPALRIAGKWLRANSKYVSTHIGDKEGKGKGRDRRDQRKSGSSEVRIADVPQLWYSLARFSNALVATFPESQLIPLTRPLKEDVEMRGFLPLRNLMKGSAKNDDGQATGTEAKPQDGGHPNDEQLMRIADLIEDAKALANSENSPIVLRNGLFVLEGADMASMSPRMQSKPRRIPSPALDEIPPPREPNVPNIPFRDAIPDDDAMTTASRTTDDPVGDAFRQVLDASDEEEEDDDDEEIVWDPRGSSSPLDTRNTLAPPSPIGTRKQSSVPSLPLQNPAGPSGPGLAGLAPREPTVSSPAMRIAGAADKGPNRISATGTTAQDLLNKMGLNSLRIPSVQQTPQIQASTAPQPQLLFGSGSPSDPSHSIWSTSLGGAVPAFQSGGAGSPTRQSHLRHQSQQYSLSPSQNMSQPAWPSSYDMSSQNSQSYLGGGLPSASYIHQAHSLAVGGLPSPSIPPSQGGGRSYDSFGYPQSIQQFGQPAATAQPSSIGSSHLYATSGPPFAPTSYSQNYSTQELRDAHDPRRHAFVPPPVSQLWGNSG